MLLGSNYQAWKKKIYLNQVPQASASCCIFKLNDQVMSSRWPKGQFDRGCPVALSICELSFSVHPCHQNKIYLLTYFFCSFVAFSVFPFVYQDGNDGRGELLIYWAKFALWESESVKQIIALSFQYRIIVLVLTLKPFRLILSYNLARFWSLTN